MSAKISLDDQSCAAICNIVSRWVLSKGRENDALFLVKFDSVGDLQKWMLSTKPEIIRVYVDSMSREWFGKSPLGKSEFAPPIIDALSKNDKVLMVTTPDEINALISLKIQCPPFGKISQFLGNPDELLMFAGQINMNKFTQQ